MKKQACFFPHGRRPACGLFQHYSPTNVVSSEAGMLDKLANVGVAFW